MVPPVDDPIWARLITGEAHVRSANVAINMLLFNSRLQYQRDPSPQNLGQLVSKAHGVFAKYEKALSNELCQLFG
jgi:hypothetical protein